MSSLYEKKMPAYLAMSRGDLIAEILASGEVGIAHLEKTQPPPSLMEAMTIEHPDDVPANVTEAYEIVRIANSVLRERFGVTIDFHYDRGAF